MVKLISIIIAALIFWLAAPLLIHHFVIPTLEISDKNVNSIYSAVSSLFSALAFTVIALTLWLQEKQLNLQKKALVLTQKENNTNIHIAAYSSLLNYYNSSGTSYNPKVCELSPMDIARELNVLLGKSESE